MCAVPQAREATPRALELRGKKVVLLLSSIEKGRDIELRLLRVGAVHPTPLLLYYSQGHTSL